jgi:RNA polymerase sigma factor (sigma-70 family)
MKPSSESQSTDPNRLVSALGEEVAPAPPRRRRFAPASLRVLSDAKLARLAAKGDRAAFAAIFDRYRDELYRYCLSLVRDREDAADALQSTMVRALRALDGDDRHIALRPWLYRIAHNESINMLRRPHTDAPAELQVSAVHDVEATAAVRERLDALLSDLRDLPERQRGALVMRELAGLNYSEIAEALETSSAGAKQAVYDARRALYAMAQARDEDCTTIQRILSDGDRRVFRGRIVRAHLRACDDCRAFRDEILARERKLGALAPTMPMAAAAQALQAATAGAGASLSGPTGAGILAGIGTTAAAAPVAALAVAAVLGMGAVEISKIDVGKHSGPPVSQVSPRLAAPVAMARAGSPDVAGKAGSRVARSEAQATARGAAAAGGRGEGKRGSRSDAEEARSDSAGQSGTPYGTVPSGPTRGGPGHNDSGRLRPGQPGGGGVPVRDAVREIRDSVTNTVGDVREVLPVETPDVTAPAPRLQPR